MLADYMYCYYAAATEADRKFIAEDTPFTQRTEAMRKARRCWGRLAEVAPFMSSDYRWSIVAIHGRKWYADRYIDYVHCRQFN